MNYLCKIYTVEYYNHKTEIFEWRYDGVSLNDAYQWIMSEDEQGWLNRDYRIVENWVSE